MSTDSDSSKDKKEGKDKAKKASKKEAKKAKKEAKKAKKLAKQIKKLEEEVERRKRQMNGEVQKKKKKKSSSSSSSSSSSKKKRWKETGLPDLHAPKEPKKVLQACPQCGEEMLWSDLAEGEYSEDWLCDNVETCGSSGSKRRTRWRWNCARCTRDLCRDCRGVPEDWREPEEPEKESSESSEESNPERHEGATCDNCEMCPIIGPRFKCSSCEDLSLCRVCYKKRGEFHQKNHRFFAMKLMPQANGVTEPTAKKSKEAVKDAKPSKAKEKREAKAKPAEKASSTARVNVPAVGMLPMGMPAMSMPQMGMPPMGMPPMGMPQMGVPPMGMPQMGMPMGMQPMGMQPMGMPPVGMPPIMPAVGAMGMQGMGVPGMGVPSMPTQPRPAVQPVHAPKVASEMQQRWQNIGKDYSKTWQGAQQDSSEAKKTKEPAKEQKVPVKESLRVGKQLLRGSNCGLCLQQVLDSASGVICAHLRPDGSEAGCGKGVCFPCMLRASSMMFGKVRITKEIWVALGEKAWWMHERCMGEADRLQFNELIQSFGLQAKLEEASAELPPGWSRKISHSTGKVFYVNEKLGKAQWVLPTAAEGAEAKPAKEDASESQDGKPDQEVPKPEESSDSEESEEELVEL